MIAVVRAMNCRPVKVKWKLKQEVVRERAEGILQLTYFKFGMVGVGKNYSALITAASRDCNLSEKKVHVNYSLYVYILCFYFTYNATHKKN